MGNCIRKPKTSDGDKPEAAGQDTNDAKETILNSNNGEATVKDKTDPMAADENGDSSKDENKDSIKQEAEVMKETTPEKDEPKTEAPAEAEKIAGETLEEKKVEVST
ncbi:uncharacterized protein LOC110018003 [Phalaenopsis equestris]|uniref:uncharacterized protein LOC110018003 n=1 Tax=Phalaenopsis equestris TaxID=78828 RepID=UPI0009E41A61|nr:uncharacterized protein LOC110018003 [Phalaenopsis equestris]